MVIDILGDYPFLDEKSFEVKLLVRQNRGKSEGLSLGLSLRISFMQHPQ